MDTFAQMSVKPLGTENIERYIRTIPDFPKPGIMFKDICPLLAVPEAFGELTDRMAHEVRASGAQYVAGLESRGFILGIAVAQKLALPFIPVRKAGKLPGDVERFSYDLEYGSATLEIQRDAFPAGAKVAIVDDLLATGGTAGAAAKLVEALQGEVAGMFFAIELPVLQGKEKLKNYSLSSVLRM